MTHLRGKNTKSQSMIVAFYHSRLPVDEPLLKRSWVNFPRKRRVWQMSGKWDMMHPRFGQDLGDRCQVLWQNVELDCLHSKSCSIHCSCRSSNQTWSSLIAYLSVFLLTIQSYSKCGIKYYQGLFNTFPDKRITKNASVGAENLSSQVFRSDR